MQYKLNKNFDADNNNLFIKLSNDIKKKFKLNGDFNIYEIDKGNTVNIDDMNDIKDSLDEHEDNKNFILHLYIKNISNMQVKQTIIKYK